MKKQIDNREKTKKNKKESELVTKESLCAVCALFSVVAILILFTRSLIFGVIGTGVHSFLVGVFGYLAYPVLFGTLYLCITSLIEKRFVRNRKVGVCIALSTICLALTIHTATTYSWDLNGYISACYFAGGAFPKATPAGWLGGIFVFLLVKLTTRVGTIVILSCFAVFFGYMAYTLIKKSANKPSITEETIATPVEIPLQTPAVREIVPTQPYAPVMKATPVAPVQAGQNELTGVPQQPAVSLDDTAQSQPENYLSSREFLFGSTPAELYQKNRIFDPNSRANQRSMGVESSFTPSYLDAYQNDINESADANRNVAVESYETFDREERIEPAKEVEEIVPQTPVFERYTPPVEETLEKEEERVEERNTDREFRSLFTADNPNVFGNDDESRRFAAETFGREIDDRDTARLFAEENPRESRGLFDDETDDDPYTLRDDFTRDTRGMQDETPTFESRGRGFDEVMETPRVVEPEPIAPVAPVVPVAEPTPPAPPKPRVIRPYVRVPLDDFDCRDVEPTSNLVEVEETKRNIIDTLEEFKVSGATIASVTFGPTVTRYNVAIPRAIPPRKVVALDQSIAISLHSSGVNIYPNYEDGVVSIEVPNKDRQFVQLGCMLTGDTFVNAKSSSLMFTMGKDVGNRKIYGDISKMIHLLVAGSSGSGKSVFLGSLIISLIYKYSPEELRLILIDPKKTEFVLYNDLPHLMINEIITDVNKAVQSLNWAIGEMNRRYGLFEQMSRAGTYVVNLDQYNEHLEKNERLPKIVIIIDELADLMLAAKKDIEDRIQNLTQKARAAGIHLIVATQRPSTDVITGVIKSNLPTRIAFAVATDVDSRVILDQTGAQKLLGKGDFLYTMQGINTPVRVQSAFISAEDSQRVVNFIKANNEAYYDESATTYINNTKSGMDGGDSIGGGDEVEGVYIEALRYVIISGSASISMIQRKCSVGYNKAGKIVEWMEDMGYISSFDGAKARKVLITKEEFESKYGRL